jgi:hypothetical protein
MCLINKVFFGTYEFYKYHNLKGTNNEHMGVMHETIAGGLAGVNQILFSYP